MLFCMSPGALTNSNSIAHLKGPQRASSIATTGARSGQVCARFCSSLFHLLTKHIRVQPSWKRTGGQRARPRCSLGTLQTHGPYTPTELTCSSNPTHGSTPRRFGKVRRVPFVTLCDPCVCVVIHVSPGHTPHMPTRLSLTLASQTFSIGIFAACMALTQKCEIVVFRYNLPFQVPCLVTLTLCWCAVPVPPAALLVNFWNAWSSNGMWLKPCPPSLNACTQAACALTISACRFIRLLGHEPIEVRLLHSRCNSNSV